MDQEITPAQYESLSDTLWEERHLAGMLLYKLVSARLILAADDRRYVAPALSEVERVIEALRGAEARRHAAVSAIARRLGLDPEELSLRRLAEDSPEPWHTIFTDHRDNFLQMAAEIEQTAADNRRLASSALESVHSALGALTGAAPLSTYTEQGHRSGVAHTPPSQLDQVL